MDKPNAEVRHGYRVVNEAVALLHEGSRVVLPVAGNSMLPFIIGGKESLELVRPTQPLKAYDVVLAWVDNQRYAIHRIVSIEGEQLTLMGDGNLAIVEHCRMEDVEAVAEYVVSPKGKRRYLYTPNRLRFAHLWRRLLPVRRWILAIYRRTLLKLNIVI